MLLIIINIAGSTELANFRPETSLEEGPLCSKYMGRAGNLLATRAI
jgi:hypothetical protein